MESKAFVDFLGVLFVSSWFVWSESPLLFQTRTNSNHLFHALIRSLREAAISLELLRKTSVEDFGTLKDRVFDASIEASKELSSDVAKRLTYLDKIERGLQKQVCSLGLLHFLFEIWPRHNQL